MFREVNYIPRKIASARKYGKNQAIINEIRTSGLSKVQIDISNWKSAHVAHSVMRASVKSMGLNWEVMMRGNSVYIDTKRG